jgi:adenine/guanine/hypoxanthine permease
MPDMNGNKRNRLFDYFQLQQHHSSWKKEFIAGGTTFFTVAYILVVNPAILSDAGIPHTFAFLATVFSTVIGSLLMGLYANAPLVLTPGMGVNAFFAYTLVLGLGLTWQQGLAAVAMAGVIFIIAAFSPLGHVLSVSIPDSLKYGITAGIGVFLTFIGLQKGMLVTAHPDTLVALGDFTEPQAILSLFGLLLTLLVYSSGW